jgi:transposase
MKDRDARSLGQTTQAELRRQAVKMRKAGQSRGAVAEALGVHRKTITRWSGEHRQRGAALFVARRRGPKLGAARRLSPAQEKALQRMIIEKTPDQLKLAFALWTRRAVCELIAAEFALRMPIRTCGEYLKRWGFTPQKPARRAYEQNPAAVQRWMEETYPAIATQAREEGAEIHWGDETGVRSDCQHGRCYAPKGQTPVVRLTARRFSVNMISTVTNQGKVRWMIYRDTLHSAVFIRFLERLIKDAARKVFLIVDNLKVHHSKPVKEWLALHGEQIAILYLPSYSPERNPDEYLNGDLKASLGSKRPPRDRQQLETNLASHMRRLSKLPKHVGSYFQNQYVRYAA